MRDVFDERRREYRCLGRNAGSTAQKVRCAASSPYAGQGVPAALQRIPVPVGSRMVIPRSKHAQRRGKHCTAVKPLRKQWLAVRMMVQGMQAVKIGEGAF